MRRGEGGEGLKTSMIEQYCTNPPWEVNESTW